MSPAGQPGEARGEAHLRLRMMALEIVQAAVGLQVARDADRGCSIRLRPTPGSAADDRNAVLREFVRRADAAAHQHGRASGSPRR